MVCCLPLFLIGGCGGGRGCGGGGELGGPGDFYDNMVENTKKSSRLFGRSFPSGREGATARPLGELRPDSREDSFRFFSVQAFFLNYLRCSQLSRPKTITIWGPDKRENKAEGSLSLGFSKKSSRLSAYPNIISALHTSGTKMNDSEKKPYFTSFNAEYLALLKTTHERFRP